MESNGLPISIRTSPANQHDSTKFIDVLENISDFLNDDLIHAIVSAYADKGYDAAYIRNYLRCYGINCCIPYKKNSKTVSQNKNQKYYGKTRFVVERFLHGSNVDFIELQSDMRGIVIIILDLFTWHQF